MKNMESPPDKGLTRAKIAMNDLDIKGRDPGVVWLSGELDSTVWSGDDDSTATCRSFPAILAWVQYLI